MSLDMLRATVKECPKTPGVYIVKNQKRVPIYIGKARSLRSRLVSHFGPQHHPDFKENLIRRDARSIQIVETGTEAEALLLEASLIKEHKPQYNQALKDDKSYPYLKITTEDFPRLIIVRGRKGDGCKYYGPYTNVGLLRQSVAFLRRMFPLRTCHPMPKKVCLMYHIGQCRGPCEDKVDQQEYSNMIKEIQWFLEGKRDTLVRYLGKRMKAASAEKDYESARLYRDQIQALASVRRKKEILNEGLILQELEERLKLSKFPYRIEAFDISNFAGKNMVASMVVFENGKPARKEYRKFKIKTVSGIDDYDAMREVVRRRYERVLAEKGRLPDLILIDGGKGHLACAKEQLDLLNLSDLDIISIAKQHEYLYKPGRSNPYVLSQSAGPLKMLRHLRDEAHRFAITFYRSLHRKEMVESELDDIPGIGPKKKTLLLKHFKKISTIKSANAPMLAEVSGINMKIAKIIEDYFKRR